MQRDLSTTQFFSQSIVYEYCRHCNDDNSVASSFLGLDGPFVRPGTLYKDKVKQERVYAAKRRVLDVDE